MFREAYEYPKGSSFVDVGLEGSHFVVHCPVVDEQIQSAIDAIKPAIEKANAAYDRAVADSIALRKKQDDEKQEHERKLGETGKSLKF